jgi:hypothetical protein
VTYPGLDVIENGQYCGETENPAGPLRYEQRMSDQCRMEGRDADTAYFPGRRADRISRINTS